MVNLQSSFFILFLFSLFFSGCSEDIQIKKSALSYFEEGNAALKHRDYQIAIWNYQKAISLDSESPNFHYNLGLTYYEIGNYQESIDSFKKVESLVPSQTDTYYNLALAHYKMSNSRMADIYYNRYQDMLSLRKAQERLDEVRKAQKIDAKNKSIEPELKKKDPNLQLTKKKTNLKKTTNQAKSEIPKWD